MKKYLLFSLVVILFLFFQINLFSQDANPSFVGTYLGADAIEKANAIAIDSQGYVYMVGETGSTEFHGVNGYDTNYHGSGDVLVAKFTPDLKQLVASTLLGGAGTDTGYGITIAPDGNVIIVGVTGSKDFPITNNALDKTLQQYDSDGFIAIFSNDLKNLLFSTYLGGSKYDSIKDLKISPNGDIYLLGETGSDDFPFLSQSVSFNQENIKDVFIAKFSYKNKKIEKVFLIDSGGWDYPVKIAIDKNGNVIAGIIGSLSSDQKNKFQVFDNSYINTTSCDNISNYSRKGIIYVAKLDPSLNNIISSAYICGHYNSNLINDLKVDNEGNIYIAGQINYKDGENFPFKNLKYDYINCNSDDGVNYCTDPSYIIKFDNNLTKIIASTKLPSSNIKTISILNDKIYLSGVANGDFYITKDAYRIFPLGGDGFFTVMDKNLNILRSSFLLLGLDSVYKMDMLTTDDNKILLAGTISIDHVLALEGDKEGYDTEYNGGGDAFIVKFDSDISKSNTKLPFPKYIQKKIYSGFIPSNSPVSFGRDVDDMILECGDKLDFIINIPDFDIPVDVYIALKFPDNTYYVLNQNSNFSPLNNKVEPFKVNLQNDVYVEFIRGLDVCNLNLKKGYYQVNALIVPSNGGDFSKIDWYNGYLLFTYYFEVK